VIDGLGERRKEKETRITSGQFDALGAEKCQRTDPDGDHGNSAEYTGLMVVDKEKSMKEKETR
jgi:hypothetical protein